MSTGDDLTEQADENITEGGNNGHNVISRLARTMTRNMNGQTLNCSLIYETRVAQSHVYYIEVSCKWVEGS